MGHSSVIGKEHLYKALAERLNRNPVGAPVNEILMEILYRLYSETEAKLASRFPLIPMTLEEIAVVTEVPAGSLRKILADMADKGLVVDIPREDGIYYMLSPMVVGFFEYSFMRVDKGIEIKELAELFERYFSSEGVREEIFGAPTKMFRALVYESVVSAIVQTEVLSYEKASEVIRQAGGGALSVCPCRHKASHLGVVCGAPMHDVCTSLGRAAEWLVAHGFARRATVDELLRVLEKTEKLGMVHLGDNVLNRPAYICHCCGCCCGVLRTITETGIMSVQPSNFVPEIQEELCQRCGLCAERCHIKAIRLEPRCDASELPAINGNVCIGCGVCASVCPSGAIVMRRRATLYTPPANKKEQLLAIAREKGRV